jgi:hypothetical protein
VKVEHRGGRSVADTDAMAAVTGRTAWAIRAHCTRQPAGYDVDDCAATLAAIPDPILLTAAQAQQYLGIPAGTVRSWASRDHLQSHDRDQHGHPLYDLLDLARLRTTGEPPESDGG